MEARAFSTGKAYAKGDLVLYEGDLYRFTAAHAAGAWTGSDAAAVDDREQLQVTMVVSAYHRALDAAAFGSRISFAPALISGDRYQYTFMTA